MKNKEYYLCSEDVVKIFGLLRKSQPIVRWGNSCYVIETSDFGAIEKYYNENEDNLDNFWAYQIIDSQVRELDFDFVKQCKENGFFETCDAELGIGKECNLAYVMFRVSELYGMDPISFVNKVLNINK